MKPKKSKKANLENLRTIFFQIGMILTLSAILLAFEWTSSYEYIKFDTNLKGPSIIEEIIPITRETEKIEPIRPPTPIEVFEIVDDNEEIDDPLIFIDDEDINQPIWDDIFSDEPEDLDEPVLIAQFMPTFQGKDASYFRKYVAENVKFPEDARRNSVSGTVYISFVIDKDGTVSNIELVRGVHKVIDNAVVKVIKKSPRWEPGINNGKFVRVKYTIAIAFRLE